MSAVSSEASKSLRRRQPQPLGMSQSEGSLRRGHSYTSTRASFDEALFDGRPATAPTASSSTTSIGKQRFTTEEKACFRRIPTPSSTCAEKSKTYWQTTGRVRSAMTAKGLSCLPVDKGEFYNHPSLKDRRKSHSRSAKKTNSMYIKGHPPPLAIEPLAAAVLEEILPLPPSKNMMHFENSNSHSASASPMAASPTSVPTGSPGSSSSPMSPCLTKALAPAFSSQGGTSAPVAKETGANRFLWLRNFRQAILAKFSTVVQAYEMFAREVDPEHNLTKPEWRRLLSNHGFLEFASRKEINCLFAELDISGDNQVSLKEWYIALEMAAPVRSLEALRRRWISSGYKSMTQAIRVMDKDDNLVGSRRLELAEFGTMLSMTDVTDESEHRYIFSAICGGNQTTTSLEELHCAIAAVSPSLLLEELRDKLSKRFKGDFKRAFFYIDEDNEGVLSMKEFLNVATRKLDLNRIEAEKMFREIDLDGSGELSEDEFISAMTIVEPSLFYEELRLKVRQRYHSIKEALNRAFADEVTDGLDNEAMIGKYKFMAALTPLGLMESEAQKLFDLVDNNGDGELSVIEFVKGVHRFAPACVLEDLSVRCCQEYGVIRQAFVGISSRKWAEQLNTKAFVKKLTSLRLMASSGTDDMDVQAIFDLLDVNNEGAVTIGRLSASLAASGAGAMAKLPPHERDIRARETVHSDVASVQRKLWELRKDIRYGLETEAYVSIPQEKLDEQLRSNAQASAAAAYHDGAEAKEGGGVHMSHREGPAILPPKLKTATTEEVNSFLRPDVMMEHQLKAVPALAADCTCAAELAVLDTKDSFVRVWQRIHDTPPHLQPTDDMRGQLHNYYQTVVMKLSQDAPLQHKVESRLATYNSSRIAQGGLRPVSQGGMRRTGKDDQLRR